MFEDAFGEDTIFDTYADEAAWAWEMEEPDVDFDQEYDDEDTIPEYDEYGNGEW